MTIRELRKLIKNGKGKIFYVLPILIVNNENVCERSIRCSKSDLLWLISGYQENDEIEVYTNDNLEYYVG